MPKGGRVLYIALGLIALISLSYRVRETLDRMDLLLRPEDHVRDPFGMDLPATEISNPEPDGTAAGLKAGDVLVAFAGRPFRGAVDLHAPLREARPLERVDVTVRSDGAIKDATIELKPYRDTAVGTAEAVQQIIFNVMPFFCMLLGFWVAVVRVNDPRAWLFLAMMISFAEFNGRLVRSWLGYDDFFQPIGAAYQVFAANFFGPSMLLFGLYFPERFAIDRRLPWLKWLLISPLLLAGIQRTLVVAFAGRHIETAVALSRWDVHDRLVLILGMAAVSGFFVCIAYKTFAAASRDARRRLLLLYVGGSLTMGPALVVVLISLISGNPVFALSAWFTGGILIMVVGFPVTMAYVIVVERAMDVRVVIRQGVQYLLASKGITVLQVLLSAILIVMVASMGGPVLPMQVRIILIAAGIAGVLLIRQFAIKLRLGIDRRFFREAYDAEHILNELADKVRTIVETRLLLETVTHRISESLHVPRVAVLLNGGDAFRVAYAVGYPVTPRLEIAADSPDVEKTTREHLDAELVLTLARNQRVLGLLSLGPKRSEEPYSKGDVRLLGSVATQTGLALENSRLTAEIAAEVAQRERFNREIEIAREVQERLFPQELPEVSGLDYSGLCRPALGVGGDYYDFLLLPDSQLGIAIGDVSGKGIPAALLMASLRASLRGQTIDGANDLAALMSNLNKLVYESSSSNRYATFFYAQYDPATRILAYVNAGHNPPLIFRESGQILKLETGGPVVGLLPAFRYDQAFITLESGDTLVAFTDGISEAMNGANEEWGEDRLVECVSRLQGRTAREMIAGLIASVDEFAAGAMQHDDMTLIVANVGKTDRS